VIDSQLDVHGMTPDDTTIYLCGNPDMITAVEEVADGRGFPPEQVRKELYWPKGRSH
jgi:ferredoxin-NADP reductase